MLPDFPQLKERIKEKTEENIRVKVQQYPALSQLCKKKITIHEGDSFFVTTSDGHSSRSGYEELVSEVSIDEKTAIEKGPAAFYESASNIAKDIADKRIKQTLSVMEKGIRDSGNVVSAKGTGITPSLILDCIEKMEIDFDARGNPIMPTIFMSPKNFEILHGKEKEWESQTFIISTIREAIIENKRADWVDRESRRKLVD
ncbi:MAG: hypothetical protein LBB87_05975 [Nitrososphaerota archaeon]|jgi:hypothetical protein|nr:hypothetical protein [Nitrososphaerota archaeon]